MSGGVLDSECFLGDIPMSEPPAWLTDGRPPLECEQPGSSALLLNGHHAPLRSEGTARRRQYLFANWHAGQAPPKGWDCADAIEDGWTQTDVDTFIRASIRPFVPTASLAAASGPSPRPAATASGGDPASVQPARTDGWTGPKLERFIESSTKERTSPPNLEMKSNGPLQSDLTKGESAGEAVVVAHQNPAIDRSGIIHPTAFQWRDPCLIPPREWLYGTHLIRKFVSATIAPGGVGKSTLVLTDGIALASGRALLGTKPHGPLTVWAWNGEDPVEEMERRVVAACLRLGVDRSEIEGRLYLDSGRDMLIKVASLGKAGPEVDRPVIDALVSAIIERNIDVLIIDPLVAIHSVAENDNGAMDLVVKSLAQIAHRANCAIEVVHHTRKLNGAESDMDAARGGSAIAGAVRSARALNVMSPEAASGFGISEGNRRSYVRVDDVKANLASQGSAHWFRLVGEPLGNHRADRPEDWVAVAEAWSPPDATAGIGLEELAAVQGAIHEKCLRENIQANNWVGHEIGRVLSLNSHKDPERRTIKTLLRQWLQNGSLVTVVIRDEKGHDRPTIEVGEWAKSP